MHFYITCDITSNKSVVIFFDIIIVFVQCSVGVMIILLKLFGRSKRFTLYIRKCVEYNNANKLKHIEVPITMMKYICLYHV